MRREINLTTGEEVELPDAPPSNPTPPDLSQIDTDTLNATLAADGSVVRALAEVLFSEINVLRNNAGLAARTRNQFIAALKAQMRT
jgi:hypothetical protein